MKTKRALMLTFVFACLLTSFCFTTFPMIETIKNTATPTYFQLLPPGFEQEIEARIFGAAFSFRNREQALEHLKKFLGSSSLMSNKELMYMLMNKLVTKFCFVHLSEIEELGKLISTIHNVNMSQWFKDFELVQVIKRRLPLEMVMELLESGCNVHAQVNGTTSLVVAAQDAASLDIFNFLIGLGANINGCDECGRSVLFHAISGMNTQAVKKLLELKADLFVKDTWGRTSLWACISAGRLAALYEPEKRAQKIQDILKIIELLINAGADMMQALNKKGKTLLSAARKQIYAERSTSYDLGFQEVFYAIVDYLEGKSVTD